MQIKNKNSIIVVALMAMAFLGFDGVALATNCTDAGDFSGVCAVLVNIFNASMAVISIVTTGNNASIIIEAVIILAIVTFVVDLARGRNSWIRGKMGGL
jgi:hypothetical protein